MLLSVLKTDWLYIIGGRFGYPGTVCLVALSFGACFCLGVVKPNCNCSQITLVHPQTVEL